MSSTERTVLLQLLQGSTGAAYASSSTGWDETTPVCDWDGITCDGNGRVTRINLSAQRLEGTIPNTLNAITTLTEVFLGSNKYSGSIPKSICLIPNLVTLDLTFNELTGTLPAAFSSAALQFLSLAHNRLEGVFPVSLSDNLAQVRKLDLQYNRLSGSIPDMQGDLDDIEEFNLSNNLFSGTIPTWFGRLATLQRLFLSNNRLTGTIPLALTDRVLSISQLFLHGNMLTGTLPAALADLPNLNLLFIDDNKLTGTVPQELCDMNLNEAFFHNGGGNTTITDVDKTYEELYGDASGRGARRTTSTSQMEQIFSDPSFRHMQRQGDPATERDGCTSIACPAGYKSVEGGKDGVFPCEMCDSDHLNPYLGSNSCFEVTEGEILRTLYEATNGPTTWTGASNWGDQSVSACEKEGVTCTTSGEIYSIVLEKKGLSGTLPPDVGFLPRLRVLDLSDNEIGGGLPQELRLPPLEELDISNNQITGKVPVPLCTKQGLNGNGKDGIFSCDTVACRARSAAPRGYADAGPTGDKCSICQGDRTEDNVLGVTECAAVKEVREGITPFGVVGEVAIALVGVFIIVGLFWFWRRSKVSRDYINDRAYHVHGRGRDEMETRGLTEEQRDGEADGGNQPSAIEEEVDPLAGIEGIDDIESHLTTMEVKVKDEWSSKRESQKEVWLDVPKIQ